MWRPRVVFVATVLLRDGWVVFYYLGYSRRCLSVEWHDYRLPR